MKEVSRINIWITFIIYSLIASGWILYASFSVLMLIMYYPIQALGRGIGYFFVIYYLLYIPCRIMWDRLGEIKNE